MNKENLLRMLQQLSKRSDLSIAVLLALIVAMMILPMPTAVVDTLIGLSMASAIVLMMVAVYINSPLAFSAFPSVLLLTTLFRLALSITTTRLILLYADAGDVVATFGNFVVAGSLIVGIVVFLIITIVQFIVITKGSERVAEVSARFSLDAMPGKQMSIDSDMRAGVIDMDEAAARRTRLEKESQLYGSMDGAMKFVKGDAIAGLCIIVVNIIGGISIGVFQNNMPMGDALKVYTILTIGDGLVAQIPALLIAIAAGIIVTRVTTDGSSNLGGDIGGQIAAQPKALIVGGAAMLGFALVPGFPAAIFLILATLLGGTGAALEFVARRRARAQDPLFPGSADGVAVRVMPIESVDGAGGPAPIVIELCEGLRTTLSAPVLNTELAKVKMALSNELGVPFPGVDVRFIPNEPNTPANYRIYLHDVPVAEATLPEHRLLVAGGGARLEMLGVRYDEEGLLALPGFSGVWVDSSSAPALRDAGIVPLDIPQILGFHLSSILKRYADDFVGIQETRYLLDQAAKDYKELAKEVQNILSLQKTADVFKRLVAEGVSIGNMRIVLEALAEWGQKETDPAMLAEHTRAALKRNISHKYSAGQKILPVFLIDAKVEETIRNGIRQTPAGSFLALEPAVTNRFMENIKNALGNVGDQTATPSLVTSVEIRRHVRKLLETEHHDLPVLSYQELSPEITVQPICSIGL